jgi:hypothetical protein
VTNSTGMGVHGGWDCATGVERYHAKSISDLKDLRRPNTPRWSQRPLPLEFRLRYEI